MRYILVVELFQQQIVVDRIKRLLKVNQQNVSFSHRFRRPQRLKDQDQHLSNNASFINRL